MEENPGKVMLKDELKDEKSVVRNRDTEAGMGNSLKYCILFFAHGRGIICYFEILYKKNCNKLVLWLDFILCFSFSFSKCDNM
jgi:hypothetical protein